jgi:hypothetical protein
VIQDAAHAALGGWEDFYLIVGSAAAALTGLQFVVITLVSEAQSRSTSTGALGAFATPTIVHFCAALFVSVVMCAPWPRLPEPAFVIGAGGSLGLIYTGVVVLRATRQTAYHMVAEDWIWHVTLPLIAYGMQLVAGFVLLRATMVASFTIAASSLLLVYIGIHNAWDTSTFMIEERIKRESAGDATRESAPPPPGELAAPTETR